MKRIILSAIMIFLAASCGAHGIGSVADISVIDRESGMALPIHFYHGEYWVAGQPGARYAIEIHNRSGERLLAVTSVDGINVVSGATAAWDQGGYVFGPEQVYQITGWRKSTASVAAFTFTDASNSYAQRSGRPANIGVIGVALFRERQSPPLVQPVTVAPSAADKTEASRYGAGEASLESSAARSSSAKTPPTDGLWAPKLGTGHGAREDSYVDYTDFARLQSQPNELIRIHYDSLDNLLAKGVVRMPPQAAPDPFPGSGPFVPDPKG